MRNLTTNVVVFDNVNNGTSTSFQVAVSQLTAGHSYRIAVGATVNGVTDWRERVFSVRGQSDYNTMNRQALAMEILNRYHGTSTTGLRIDMAVLSGVTHANRRTPFANIEDTANGLMATTRPHFEIDSSGIPVQNRTPAPNVFLSEDLFIPLRRFIKSYTSYK